MRDSSAPQRSRAVAAQSDRLIERARCLVRTAEAEQRVTESLPCDRVLREDLRGSLEAHDRVGILLVTEQHVRLIDDRVRGLSTHPLRLPRWRRVKRSDPRYA